MFASRIPGYLPVIAYLRIVLVVGCWVTLTAGGRFVTGKRDPPDGTAFLAAPDDLPVLDPHPCVEPWLEKGAAFPAEEVPVSFGDGYPVPHPQFPGDLDIPCGIAHVVPSCLPFREFEKVDHASPGDGVPLLLLFPVVSHGLTELSEMF